MAVKFFSPNNPFGALAGWELQTGANPSETEQRAAALGEDGDEIAWKGYGKDAALSCTFVATAASGYLTLPDAGAVVGGAHIDSISVAYNQEGFPIMTVNGHKHIDGTGHTTPCRRYRASVKLPAKAIGCPRLIECVSPSTAKAFMLTPAAKIDVRGMTYTLGCTHVDEKNAEGGHLAGDNYDGVETLSVELTGEADPTEFAVDSAWHLGTDGRNNSNTTATTSSLALEHHVAHTPVTP